MEEKLKLRIESALSEIIVDEEVVVISTPDLFVDIRLDDSGYYYCRAITLEAIYYLRPKGDWGGIMTRYNKTALQFLLKSFKKEEW